tara:strand:- start:451 stop:3612 length:3162 start_codon:yes stop_codon:yes gene_type:complete
MAKTQLIRKSFNAGELSPELHYRDDLEAYVKGCKHLTNMTATPYGAVTRRPPFEVLTRIDAVLYGVPVRYIPFKFSLTEVFHIVFTDGSGTESTDPTTADLIIFDEDGDQVFFDGSPTTVPLSGLPLALNSVAPSPVGALNSGTVAMVNTIYDPADLHKIHYINVNDFVYMTCGGKYPVQAINRFFDKDEGGNRWKIAEWEILGGPFLDPNINLQDKLTTSAPLWDSVAAYEVGETVFDEGPSKPYIGNDYFDRAWISGSLPSNVYHLRQSVPDHGLELGDKFFTKGMILSGGVGCTYYATGEQANNGEIIGEYSKETNYNSNFFWSNILVQVAAGGVLPTVTTTSGQFWKAEDYGNFYSCQQTVPASSGIPISNTAYWDTLERYSGEVGIKSDSGVFLPTDINRQVRIKVNNKDGTSGEYIANETASSIVATSSVTLKTEGGSWSGRLQLQESKDIGVSWETIGEIISVDGASNGSIDRDISDPNSLVRVKLVDYTVATTGDKKKCIWSLSTEGTAYEVFKITGFIDANNVTAKPLTPIASPRSEGSWALGAFSDTSGYPFSLTIHDERLALGGCQLKPNTVYASKVNEWDNFFEGSLETSPYTFTIASDSFDTIRSLKSSRQLNVLTDNAENTMGSRDDNAITSITNISVSSHTNYGSNETQAIQLADMIWFVMGQGERVRASKYDFASDGQQSIEMSLFASHITESGIKEMSFRRHPYNSLFCLLNNGTGATLTYEGMQEVRAWSTVSTDGEIISAASNYSDTGDIVAGIVKRGNFYFLEKFGGVNDDTVFLDNQTTWVDADFDAGQDMDQFDDGNLIVVADDTELVRDIDYTIDTRSVAATNPIIDGFGDAYFDLTPPFGASEVPYLVLFEDGLPCPCGFGEYSFFADNDQAIMWIKSDHYNPASSYVVKNTRSTLVIPTVTGTNVLPANCGVIISPTATTGRVTIGRRIDCRVNPTDISEVAPSGMVKRLTELSLYLIDSGTCNVKINGKVAPFTDGLSWSAGQRESGLFELTTGGDYDQGLDIDITIDNHRHFTLSGLGYRLGISQG